jgi:hypothetical protein
MPSFPCHHCGATLEIADPIPRDAECPRCMGDVRCCINCRHFDPRYNNACRETDADPVEDKDRRNFCEFFVASNAPLQAGAGTGASARQARAKLDALFGGADAADAPASGASDTAKRKLESLFGGPSPPQDAAADARAKLDALFRKRPENDD